VLAGTVSHTVAGARSVCSEAGVRSDVVAVVAMDGWMLGWSVVGDAGMVASEERVERRSYRI
jgi:hypothetical protein